MVIDYLVTTWPDHARIDARKIGMFGFSAGAFAALTTIGHDPRVKAAVVAAPGYGFTFVPNGLAKATVPVQIWSGAHG